MRFSLFILIMISALAVNAQRREKVFTMADTLRGTITPERNWWDIQRYDISVTPDYNNKTITGISQISYKVTRDNHPAKMQIDMQEPLIIDSVVMNGKEKRNFQKTGSVAVRHVEQQKTN